MTDILARCTWYCSMATKPHPPTTRTYTFYTYGVAIMPKVHGGSFKLFLKPHKSFSLNLLQQIFNEIS